MTIESRTYIRTLRLKVKVEAYPWLNAAAVEVNQVWNYANEISFKAARPFLGPPRWLSEFDLNNLTAGAAECFEHIGSNTIQRVNAEFATRRRQFQKAKLRWRVSRGAKRSLGWVPFKAAQLKRKTKSLRFSGKAIRVFRQELLHEVTWKSGCFAEKNTTRTCSSCKALTGPAGLDMLDVRSWICVRCGVTHDRDVNAARNILFAGRYPPSVSGNKPSLFSVVAEPDLCSRYEAWISALKAAV
jgi:hypothetical protein